MKADTKGSSRHIMFFTNTEVHYTANRKFSRNIHKREFIRTK